MKVYDSPGLNQKILAINPINVVQKIVASFQNQDIFVMSHAITSTKAML